MIVDELIKYIKERQSEIASDTITMAYSHEMYLTNCGVHRGLQEVHDKLVDILNGSEKD